MFRLIRIFLGTALVVSVVCVVAWFHYRMAGDPDRAIVFGRVLIYALYVMIGVAAYAAAVGAYHTFLSVTGLDGGDAEPPEPEK